MTTHQLGSAVKARGSARAFATRCWSGRSVRVRLTMLYGGLFFALGVMLVGLTYVLAEGSFGRSVVELPADKEAAVSSALAKSNQLPSPAGIHHPTYKTSDSTLTPKQLKALASSLRADTLHQLLMISIVALIATSLAAVVLGWWMAGRMLRPLHRITATARRLSSENLSDRIALDGPAGELKELADTFDEMLARLEYAFDSQRGFIANASHELRTPLTIERATLQIRLSNATLEDLPRIQHELLASNRRSEHLIDGLLLLARSDRGLARKEPVDLHEIVAEVVEGCRAEWSALSLRIELDLRPMTVPGDRLLLTQLVSNLVLNAIRYNVDRGSIQLSTSPRTGLRIRNTGPVVPAEAVPRLFEPFQRLADQRTGSATGAGLGLSIVQSIAKAHSGTVSATPNDDGGLSCHVSLPTIVPAAG